MKKLAFIMVAGVVALMAASCGGNVQQNASGEQSQETVEKNDTTGTQALLEAADKGDVEAQLAYARLAQTTAVADGPNYVTSEKYLKMAAEQGNSDAMWELAIMYMMGYDGVGKNGAEAFKWAQQSADKDNPIGFYALAVCYDSATGTGENEAKANELLKKAFEALSKIETPNVQQLRYLAHCYAEGDGVAKDEAKAAELYRKAAEQGDAASQARMGDCYSEGEGVAKDTTEATKWYDMAAKQGFPVDKQYSSKK
ncbi:MAG: sel1 repeat family protein [Muribaculaceae bacterium]|nr:sel1 repeat family protein [Muribaculaceae bacterium]